MAGSGPLGFRVHTMNSGLADDDRDDFTIVVSEVPSVSSALFTRSRFAGPSVTLSRDAAASGRTRGVVVLARNANVATGKEGADHAIEVRQRVAKVIGIEPEELLIASTGVIGVKYPMPRVRAAMDGLSWPFPGTDFDLAARAIMTTDTRPKRIELACGNGKLVGIAKGVGMLEPDMATMLAFFCSDVDIEQPVLDRIFRAVVARTFNAVSIDTDTSTSDTAAIFTNGLAGPVDPAEFEQVLEQAALHLVKEIASDGEGASKLIEVRVTGARDADQAKRVGKTIVNSPLVKTAVHGSDPNWGRVVMAIGKCQDDTDIAPDHTRVGFGDVTVYPDEPDEATISRLVEYLHGDQVVIDVDLGIADGAFTVYGCDLTEGYVRLNSAYTT
jgi:glutamate N-acetyltransferase/amino-acid N-acetyltransferase